MNRKKAMGKMDFSVKNYQIINPAEITSVIRFLREIIGLTKEKRRKTMKKYSIIALTLVLTMALFTGCRARNNQTTVPSTHVTTAPTVMPTTHPTTEATTVPHTTATVPHTTEYGTEHTTENGMTGTNGTEGAIGEGRTRHQVPPVR